MSASMGIQPNPPIKFRCPECGRTGSSPGWFMGCPSCGMAMHHSACTCAACQAISAEPGAVAWLRDLAATLITDPALPPGALVLRSASEQITWLPASRGWRAVFVRESHPSPDLSRDTTNAAKENEQR